MTQKWCDLGCRHASFPSKTALAGACNTLVALWCRKHKRLVPKNAPCIDNDKKKAGR
jgi:hypothetical protein